MAGSADIGLKIYSGCTFDKDANGYLDTDELYQLYNGTGTGPSFEDPVCHPDRSERSGAASKDATVEIFNDAVSAGQSEYEVVTAFLGLRDNVRNGFFCNSVLKDREAFLSVLRRHDPAAADRLQGSAQCVEGTEPPKECGRDILCIAPHETATIEGVSITAQDEPVMVYLKATEVPRSSSSVVFDRENKKLIVHQDKDGGRFLVSLLPGNPFVPAYGNDRMMFAVELSDNYRVEVENRDAQGRIPLITVNGRARMTIMNGINSITLARGPKEKVLSWGVSTDLNDNLWDEIPVEIRAYSEAGKELQMRRSDVIFNEQTNDAIIMDNYGGFAPIGDGIYDASQFECETSNRLDDQRELTQADFGDYVASRGAPHIRLAGDFGSAEIRQTIRYLETLPPAMLASLEDVHIEQPAEFKEKHSKNASACAGGRTIYLKRAELDIGTFHHECAHIHKNALHDTKPGFEEKWLAANRAPYATLSKLGTLGSVWNDRSSLDITNLGKNAKLQMEAELGRLLGPRYGFASAYGNTNDDEDVAEFVRLFVEFPDKLCPLIDRSDPNYDAEYGEVYRTKLKLLIEYGFIAVEEVPDWMFACLYDGNSGE